jgi:hypothetical protein
MVFIGGKAATLERRGIEQAALATTKSLFSTRKKVSGPPKNALTLFLAFC